MSSQDNSAKNPKPTEYALVAIVMGAIGLMGLPRLPAESAVDAQEEKARIQAEEALDSLRSAVEEYRAEHGRLPGHGPRGETPEALFSAQLTSRTTSTGGVPIVPWDRRANFGPYLLEVPVNPLNGLTSVRVIGPGERLPRRADGRTGWIYDVRTGRVLANARGELPGTESPAYDL